MAKKHLKEALKKLEYYYEQAESLYTEFALKTENLIISEESMEPLVAGKIALDNKLTLYSVGISGAMHERLDTLLAAEKRALSAFNTPLLLAMDNLSEDPENAATRALIAQYNRSIRHIRDRIATLNNIKLIKDLPNRNKKAKKVLSRQGLTFLMIIEKYVSEPIEHLLKVQESLYKDFLATPIEISDKGDLDE